MGRVEGESAEFIDIETIDQSGQHRHDTPEHLLTWVDTVNRDKALRHGSIETGGALDGRATRVVEKLGSLTPVTLSVSFGRIQKCRKACAVELLKQLPSAMNRRPREVFEKVSDPSNELQFETIDIRFS